VTHLGKDHEGGKAIQPRMTAPPPLNYVLEMTCRAFVLILVILLFHWLYRMSRTDDD